MTFKTTWSQLAPRLKMLFVCLVGIVIGAVLYAGLKPAPSPNAAGNPPAAGEAKADSNIAYWTCSMHPQVHLPKPGLCPICGMKLIPVYKQSEGGETGPRVFKTSPAAAALMNIETSPVERKFVTARIRMVGKVNYDETRLSYITAWVPGRLDKLYVDYTGVPVTKGDHMVYLYSPDLYGAQEELLQALQAVKTTHQSDSTLMRDITQSTVKAARDKLRLLGLTDGQIADIEKSGKARDHVTIYAPAGGIVIHKNALEGQYVQTGTKIYTIADLSKVWVNLDAYESDLSWLRYGQQVAFTTVAYPGETFQGTISFIDPVLDPATRTVRVRVEVPNSDGRLKPEMFVNATVQAEVAAAGKVMDPRLAGKWICPMHPSVIKDKPGTCDICGMPLVRTESLGYVSAAADPNDKPLVIPASAALVTGTRAVVYVQVPNAEAPTFEGRQVVLGPRAGDYYIVRHGLQEGQRVVTRGNFKIDSALQIEAKPSMMTPAGGEGAPEATLPAMSRRQLQAVLDASAVVRDAVGTLDVKQIKLAFDELGKTVHEVDASLLPTPFQTLWTENSMLLDNDAFEGGHIQAAAAAKPVADLLQTHIAQLRSQFGLASAPAVTGQNATPPVSQKFQSQLESVFKAYFTIQTALASDRFHDAAQGAAAMQKALGQVDMELLSGNNHRDWMTQAKALKDALSRMAAAQAIEPFREGFARLSEQMFALGRRFDMADQGPLYQLKCPMAFDGRGATWLQPDPDTHNPYFGSAMPQCGSVINTLGPAAAASEGGAGHD